MGQYSTLHHSLTVTVSFVVTRFAVIALQTATALRSVLTFDAHHHHHNITPPIQYHTHRPPACNCICKKYVNHMIMATIFLDDNIITMLVVSGAL